MNHIFLVVEIERSFGVKFQTAEMEELRNVDELGHLIRSKQAKAA
jgi:acyl carrier protein